MKTVGQLLQSARAKRKLTINEVAKLTRIRPQYLQALEADAYTELPSTTYAKGFIKNYAEFLGLSAETLLAVFRRDFSEDHKGNIIPRSLLKPATISRLAWTPQITLATTIGFILALFLGFIGLQYMSWLNPQLEISQPNDREVIGQPVVTVAGVTDSSAVVTVNNQLAVVEGDGSFTFDLQVSEGVVPITIVATNSRGKQTMVERVITINLSEPITAEEQATETQ
jgi:transcriptional regulator with XRE-family HTH domain